MMDVRDVRQLRAIERHARVSKMLDDWASEDGDFDERVSLAVGGIVDGFDTGPITVQPDAPFPEDAYDACGSPLSKSEPGAMGCRGNKASLVIALVVTAILAATIYAAIMGLVLAGQWVGWL